MASGSIWTGIDRCAFYGDLEKRGNHIRWNTDGILSASRKFRRKHDDHLYPFSFEVESELAGHFAFLASWSSDPSCVAAATISPDVTSEGLVVALAANEGIKGWVQTAFNDVLTILEQYSCDREFSATI